MSNPRDSLHGKVINYSDIDKTLPGYEKYLDSSMTRKIKSDLNKCIPVMFMPNSTYDDKPMQDSQYAKSKYKLVLFGIFENGLRATVCINDIEPYFEIKIPDKTENKETFAEDMFFELNMDGDADFNKFQNVIKKQLKSPPFGFKIEPTRYEIVNGKPLHIYQAYESSYIRIYFNKLSHRKDAIQYVSALKYHTAHDDMNSYYRVVSRDHKLQLGYWICLKNYTLSDNNNYLKGDVIQISINDINNFEGELPKSLLKDNMMTMAFDIETYNPRHSEDFEVPMPEIQDHHMFMISLTFQWHHAPNQLLNVCLVDVPAASHPDFLTIICNTEENLVRGFGQICHKMKPHFMMGFNSDNYDWKWIILRACGYKGVLNELVEMCDMTIVKERTDANSLYAYKKNSIKIEATLSVDGQNLQVPGFIPFDVMTIFRKLYPTSEVYNLNFFLSKNKLGGKEDMPYQEMFRIYEDTYALYKKGQDIPDLLLEKMALVGKYCVIDSIRCHDLTNIRTVLQDKREVANISYTSVHDAFYRADGMKVRNLTIAEANMRNLKLSNIANEIVEAGKYPGAMVVPPIKGLVISKLSIRERIMKANLGYKDYKDWLSTTEDDIEKYIRIIDQVGATPSPEDIKNIDEKIPNHFKNMLEETIGRPITGLDYASLYPSLMMCYNFSPEYIVLSKEKAKTLHAMKNPDGSNVHNLYRIKFDYNNRWIKGWSIRHDGNLDPSKPEFKFGLFPSILKKLFDARKKLKKGDRGLLYWEHIIEQMKLLPQEEIDKPEITEAYEDAKFAYNALDSKQKALKVFMNTFYGESGNKRSPLFMLQIAGGITGAGRDNLQRAYDFVQNKDCKVYYGDSVSADTPILIQYPEYNINNIDIKTIDDLPGVGPWIDYPQFKPNDPTLINKQQILCVHINTWTSRGWARIVRIIRHKTNKRMFRINTIKGSVDVTEDHSLLTSACDQLKSKDAKLGDQLLHGFPDTFHQHNKCKISIDTTIDYLCGDEFEFIRSVNFSHLLNAPIEVRRIFVQSIIDKRSKNSKILVQSKIVAQIIYYLFKSINYHIFILADTNDSYTLIYSDDLNDLKNAYNISNMDRIINIIELPPVSYNDYVYDIETGDGIFLAGIGEICVKNTDSLYLAMPEKEFKQLDIDYYTEKISKLAYWKKMIEITFETIVPLNKAVNDMLEADNGTKFLNMAFEESLYPYASFAKKKYMGIPHISTPNYNKDANDRFYLFIKGLALKTRGVSEVLINVCHDILQKIVDPDNILTIIEIVQKTIIDFYESDWTPPEKFNAFIMTGVYKPNKNNVRMHTFNDRMMHERGIKIIAGDRIKYVITKKYPYKFDLRGRKKALSIGDKMELADKAHEEQLPIDIDYYMDKTINGQLARFITYHDNFQVHVTNYDDKAEVKKAEDNNLKLARKFIDEFCKKYYTNYADKGGIYKTIFKRSSLIVKNKLIAYGGNDQSSKDIVKLLGFSVDPNDNLEEWLLKKVHSLVEKKKINKTYGEDYVKTLLVPATIKAQGKTRANYLKELHMVFYVAKNGILNDVEEIYHNRQQILEFRFRRSLDAIKDIYHMNNNIIESVSKHIKLAIDIDNKFNTSVDDSTIELNKDIDKYLLTNNINITEFDKTLETIAEEKISEKSEKLIHGINELKYIYYNLISNYEYVYQTRSIVEYLKQLRNKSINYIQPISEKEKQLMIESFIKESIS